MSDQGNVATATAERYRVNLSENAKGIVQVDVTAEGPDTQRSVELAVAMLARARVELRADGRKVTGDDEPTAKAPAA